MGDEADYVAPDLPTAPDPGPPDEVFRPAEPYRPDTTLPDDYRCLPVEAATDRELYVTGLRTTPQNLAVAHHVLLYAIPATEQAELDALVAQDPEPGYACFGGPAIDGAITIGGWAPGDFGKFLPDGTAIRIPQGATLVLQMHYNTSAISGDPGTDQTPVELWELPDSVVPDQVVVAYPVVKLGLDVPAGEAHSVQTAVTRIPVQGQILASTPHMHTHGTSLRTELRRSNGDSACVSDLTRWDFNWQRTYGVPDGQWIPLSIDDELELTCTYDNRDGDADLWWGEGTADEMCLDYVGLVVPWDGGTTGGTCSGYPTCDAQCADDDPFCSLGCLTINGDACLFSGLEAIFSTCVGTPCALPGLSLQACMASCAPEFEDTFGCLYEDCRASFDDYWACVKPELEAGAPGCEAEFTAVPELLGSP
jgi:hypothetical protein